MKNPISDKYIQVYSYIRCHDHDRKKKLAKLIIFGLLLFLLGDRLQLTVDWYEKFQSAWSTTQKWILPFFKKITLVNKQRISSITTKVSLQKSLHMF